MPLVCSLQGYTLLWHYMISSDLVMKRTRPADCWDIALQMGEQISYCPVGLDSNELGSHTVFPLMANLWPLRHSLQLFNSHSPQERMMTYALAQQYWLEHHDNQQPLDPLLVPGLKEKSCNKLLIVQVNTVQHTYLFSHKALPTF